MDVGKVDQTWGFYVAWITPLRYYERMTAQRWIDANPWALFVVSLIIAIPFAIAFAYPLLFLVSRASGWASLTRRFRADGPFPAQTWPMQSGRFRGWCGYNNCLTIGASPQGLYLATLLLVRFFHPPLLIPWKEIEVETGKCFFGQWDTAQLRIGTEERITLRIRGKLVNKIREAAGPAWPLYAIEQIENQTRT